MGIRLSVEASGAPSRRGDMLSCRYTARRRAKCTRCFRHIETRSAVHLISRYVLRETFSSWLIVTTVLVVIFMSNQFAETLDDAAGNELPRDAVFAVLGLTSLQYITWLAPIGLFLGILLALARMNRDSEMVALEACGVGPPRLLLPISLLTLILSTTVAWLSLVGTPEASRQVERIRQEAQESLEIGVLEAGTFTSPDSGETIIYAQAVEGNEIHDVFIQRNDGNGVVVIVAARGERRLEADGQLSFVLYDGRRYEGVPGEQRFRIVEFAEHGMPVRLVQRRDGEQPVETKTLAELAGSSDSADRAELQWRISSPLSLFVLALLAVPLSRSRPREGRYARLGIGILIYITYLNLLSIARAWVERDEVPDWLGVWWVHAMLGVLGLVLLGMQSGWFTRAGRAAPARAASA